MEGTETWNSVRKEGGKEEKKEEARRNIRHLVPSSDISNIQDYAGTTGSKDTQVLIDYWLISEY